MPLEDMAKMKWLNFPMEQKIELLRNIEKLVALEEQKCKLMGEMRRSFLHHWMKHDQSQPSSINFDLRLFKKLVLKYYECVHDEREQFELEGHQFLTAYAKYLIEYLEPEMVRMHMDSITSNVEQWLKTVRRNHDIRMKIKADPNYEPPPSFRGKLI